MDWGNKLLVDFSGGKTQLVSFDPSNNTGGPSLVNWNGALTLSLLLKLLPRKLEH